MSSIFTKIVQGQIPSYKVAESEEFYAFLDINPLAKGHCLVIPKREVDYIFDLDAKTYSGLFEFVKKVGHAIETTVPCKRLGMVVYGLDVPHAHVHLIPLQGTGNEINFSNPKVKMTQEEFTALAELIYDAYRKA